MSLLVGSAGCVVCLSGRFKVTPLGGDHAKRLHQAPEAGH